MKLNIKTLVFHRYSIDPLRIINILSVFFLFLYFLIYFIRIPLHNYDFWWHLATGKYIVETRSLPHDDPFSYTSHDTDSTRNKAILTGNWLAQVVFYKVYGLWEVKGIVILRAILLSLFLYFVFLNIRKQNLSVPASLILITGVFLLARTYPGERPQLFTFSVFSLVYYLLEDYRINRSKKAYMIPPLIMLLSNMHPGYIVCILLLSLYLVGEGARCFLSKNCKDGIIKGLLMIWFLTVILSMFNPNGAAMLTGTFAVHGEYMQGIVEYQPTFFLYANKYTPIVYSYIAFLSLSLVSLKYLRRIGIIHMLLLVVFSIMSFLALRYVIFYMCISAPVLARIIINLKDEKIFNKVKIGKGLGNVIALIVAVIVLINSVPAFARYSFKADTMYSVPEGTADFLSHLDIKGNMFNEYSVGGYLIWRLYPEKKVFIDGRLLSTDVYNEYQIVAYAAETQNQSWKDILSKYGFSYIVIPPIQFSGNIFPIVDKLLESEEWILIYTDHLSFIFVKNTFENMPIINKYAIDKKRGFDTIIIQASARAMKNKTNPYYLISLGRVFYKLGRLDDAKRAFMLAYDRDPTNREIKEWLNKLK